MSDIAKVIELVGTSEKSWQDAAEKALAQARQSLRNITGIEVTQMTADVENSEISVYRTTVKVAFGVEGTVQ